MAAGPRQEETETSPVTVTVWRVGGVAGAAVPLPEVVAGVGGVSAAEMGKRAPPPEGRSIGMAARMIVEREREEEVRATVMAATCIRAFGVRCEWRWVIKRVCKWCNGMVMCIKRNDAKMGPINRRAHDKRNGNGVAGAEMH